MQGYVFFFLFLPVSVEANEDIFFFLHGTVCASTARKLEAVRTFQRKSICQRSGIFSTSRPKI